MAGVLLLSCVLCFLFHYLVCIFFVLLLTLPSQAGVLLYYLLAR